MKFAAIFLLILCCMRNVVGAELFATVDALEGEAYVLDASGKSSLLKLGQEIHAGESIDTRQDGEVHLVTLDGGMLALRPNTLLRVDAYKAEQKDDDKVYMSLLKGALRSITGWIGKSRSDAYRLKTPTATIGVRGTDHETLELEHAADGHEAGTYHRVIQGATVMRTGKDDLEVKAGEAGFLSRAVGAKLRRLLAVPTLFTERRLRLEHRVPERRDMLKGVVEQLPEVRAERMKQILREAGQERREAGQERREGVQERREGAQERREGEQERREGVQERREAGQARREAGQERREGVQERREGGRQRVIRRMQRRP